jgi:hypothetical protein
MKTWYYSTLKISLLTTFVVWWSTGKSQTLLDADSNQIKHVMVSQGAELKKSYLWDDFVLVGTHHLMIFSFPNPMKGNSGILNETFVFTLDNKCVQYEIMYYGDNCVNKLKDSLNMFSTDLKQVNDSLKWINSGKGYDVSILKTITVRGKAKYPMCMLLVKKSNLKMRSNPFKKKE